MLKLVLDSLEGLSTEIAALYQKGADGKYHLDTEEDEGSKNKLKEFRDNNIALMKEKDALEKQIAKYGVDPEKVIEMKKRLQEIEDKKMIEAGKIDELVNQKVERMRLDYEEQIKQIKIALDEKEQVIAKTTQKLSEVLIDSEITKAVNAVGTVKKEAMTDVLSRGRQTWKLEDGKPVPKQGDRLLYGKDGKESLTFEEWAQTLIIQAPFLFEASSGGGAGGSAANRGTSYGTGVDIKTLPPQERLKEIHRQAAAGGK